MARTPRRGGTAAAAVAALAASLAVALLTPSASVAHTYSRQDGNDSPGRLDIRTASVKHGSTAVIHTIRTYEGWTVPSLGDDSFFIVAIDTNRDRDFEKCAIILKVRALRGALTNCGRQFIRSLDVAKPSGATVNVKIPEGQLGDHYRWAAFSYWTGPPAGCADTCFDAAPNGPPPILHDLIGPVVSMTSEPLRVWEDSTTATFEFPFTVSDHESGLKSWKVQSRLAGGSTWTTVASGTTAGNKHPLIAGAPGHFTFRVVAEDRQGNRTIKERPVYVPTDVTDLTGPGAFTGSATSVANAQAFGGFRVALESEGDTYQFTYVHRGGPCQTVELIGPTTGEWVVSSTDGSHYAVSIPDLERGVVFSKLACSDTTYTITVINTGGFAVDAILI
jgi:hypothetical protein